MILIIKVLQTGVTRTQYVPPYVPPFFLFLLIKLFFLQIQNSATLSNDAAKVLFLREMGNPQLRVVYVRD